MISEKETVRISRFLSLVLRHKPERIGLTLDQSGWAVVSELLEKMTSQGFAIDRSVLQYVVATNNKKRFQFNDDETAIRASQGHSLNIDLGYSQRIPPAILYHGTSEKNATSILRQGLTPQSRQHVHLTLDVETALKVGQRHGKPVLFEVAAKRMHDDGYAFYLSANGVWLTGSVPAANLKLLQQQDEIFCRER